LFLTQSLRGGTGSGYSYAVYRDSNAPNFVPGAANLIATTSSFPYTDFSAPAGPQFYKVIGSDDGGDVANAVPAGLDLPLKPAPLDLTTSLKISETYAPALAPANTKLLVIAIGDSITYGSTVNDPGNFTYGQSAPVTLGTTLGEMPNISAVTGVNRGIGGTTTGNWLPSFTTQGRYQAMKLAAQDMVAAAPDAIPVFSIMLGTNDGGSSAHVGAPMASSTFEANLVAIGNQLLTDFPNAKVVFHHPPYYSPNVPEAAAGETSEDKYARTVGYQPQVDKAVNDLNAIRPSSAFVGDHYAFNYFAANYQSELTTETGGVGNYYLHPDADGAAQLGAYWAKALYSALFATTPGGIFATNVTSSSATLNATAAPGDDGSYTYKWYRSNAAGFTPGPDSLVSSTKTCEDSGLQPGSTYYYAFGRTNLVGTTTYSRTSVKTAAATYALTGPVNGYVNAPAVFTVTANGPLYGTVIVTPSDGGAGGTFTPASVALQSGNAAIPSTFIYTPAASGPVQISVLNSGSLVDPIAKPYAVFGKAAAYGLTTTVKTAILNGQPTNLAITFAPIGTSTISPVTITPHVTGVTGYFTPSSVTLGFNQQSAIVRFTPTSTGTATISATNSGTFSDPHSLGLTVQNLLVSTVTLSPATVLGGNTSKATIGLNLPAPTGGATVTISSNSPNAIPPTSIFIPNGVQTTAFNIPTTPVGVAARATIAVTSSGATRSTTLTLSPVNIGFLTLTPPILKGGGTVTGTIKLQAAAEPASIVVAIASDQATLAKPSTTRLTIPAGAVSATFTISTGKVTTPTMVNISLTTHGVTITQPLKLSP